MNEISYKGVLDKAQYMIVTVFAFVNYVIAKYRFDWCARVIEFRQESKSPNEFKGGII